MKKDNVEKSKVRRQLLADHSYTGENPLPDSSGDEMEESGHSVDLGTLVNSPAPKKTETELS